MWAGFGDIASSLEIAGHTLASVFHHQPEALFLDRVKVRTAGNQGHVITGKAQFDPKQTTNCASADNANSHNYTHLFAFGFAAIDLSGR